MTPDELPHLLTIPQLADHLGTGVRHVRRLVSERRVPYLKVGRFVRFDPGEIDRWLDDYRVTGPASERWYRSADPSSDRRARTTG